MLPCGHEQFKDEEVREKYRIVRCIEPSCWRLWVILPEDYIVSLDEFLHLGECPF